MFGIGHQEMLVLAVLIGVPCVLFTATAVVGLYFLIRSSRR
jgi:hypothetical protein